MEKGVRKFFFSSKDLRLVPETRQVMEHFKLLFGSGTSGPAKIRPLKVLDLPDFLSGFALWDFASIVLVRVIVVAGFSRALVVREGRPFYPKALSVHVAG